MRILMTMLAANLVLLVFPTIVHSKISINIKPGKTRDETVVDFSGEDVSTISEKERITFQLNDESLKNAAEKYKGKRCTDVYLKPPTPYGDVYQKYNWKVIERTLKPVRARVVGIFSKPVSVNTAEYINDHDSISAEYSTSVEQNVEETVSHSWQTGGELSVGQEIEYKVDFGAASVGGTTSFSHTSSWGEDTTKSRVVTIGTTSSVRTTVPPGAIVLASIIASQGTMEIEIDYLALLNNGDVFCNYEETYQGHHFWAYPLRKLQTAANLPKMISYTEKLKIGFYSNAKIVITNGTDSPPILERPAEVLGVGDETTK